MTTVNTLDLTARDLDMRQRAVAGRTVRTRLGGTVAAKGRVLKESHCRELCSVRQEKKQEKPKRSKERKVKKPGKAGTNARFNGLATLAYLIGYQQRKKK